MSSSFSHPTMVPLQRVGDTVAHGTVGLATKADLDAVKASIDQLKTEQQEIKSLLIQLLQGRAPAHHAAPDRETSTVPTCGLKVSEDSATNDPSETQTDFVKPQGNVEDGHAAPVASASEEQDASRSHQHANTTSVTEVPVQATAINTAPTPAVLSSTPVKPSVSTLNEETVSAQAAAQAEEDALSDEELRELRPLRQQSTRLLCINEDFRFKTLVGLYCALKSRNPAQSSSRTRLPESQLITMARHAEFDILRGIDRRVIRRQLASVPSLILNEYSTGRQEMWSNIKYSSNFSKLIHRHQRSVREALRQSRRVTRSQSPQQIGAFVKVPRGRAGYRYRSASRSSSADRGGNAPVTSDSDFSFPRARTQIPSSMAPGTLVAYSDMLMDADLALLKEPTSAKPYNIKLANDLRSGTLVEFYDKLVQANSLVSYLKHDEALQHALVEVYQSMGTAPFWKDYLPLDTQELFRLTKQVEDDVFGRLMMDVRGGKLDVSHENAYIRLTARYRPGTDAMGLKSFAAMASKFLDRMET
ncbi:uncharacterized protein J4E78_009743 [Alternaria triticimaculans]|uniref:uncharacterized protein n=1 Tax=Alternaria triticimaculans TaxID=297637 RepID=UPI0020C5342D|nr:uncharacterized protein J4E78_009743 [Alternaria triticimaculans]KAI4643962.1 hypothetical protein J4E78_009743 [Alternaria triticimaculans]